MRLIKQQPYQGFQLVMCKLGGLMARLALPVLALSLAVTSWASVLTGPIVNSENQHLYFLLNTNSWTEAEIEAISLGGHLVTVRNADENQWLYSNFAMFEGTPRNLWIGLQRTDAGGFAWVSGETTDYNNFAEGEPNNCDGFESKGLMFGPDFEQYGKAGYWNDTSDPGIGGCGGGDLAPCGVVEITLPGPPVIVTQPASQSVVAGADATFTVVTRGTGPFSFQWRFEGSVVAETTCARFVVTNVQPSTSSGNYSVVISNELGVAESSNALLTVKVVLASGNNQPLVDHETVGFSGPVTIRLQNVYAGGPVFYTLDGTPPTFLSTEYKGPFVVTNDVVLRAIGYSVDFFESGELGPARIVIVPYYRLTYNTPGGGTISLSPPGGSYLGYSAVKVTATPAAGWTFLYWLGDLSGTNPSSTVVMSRNQTVQAVFGTTLSTTVAGNGTVTRKPACDFYPYGTVVALQAVPGAGSCFGIWGNAASGTANPLYFTVTNANKTISSLFGSLNATQAALTALPDGLGRVAVSPAANVYPINSVVSITATPEPGQSFLGWTGDAAGTDNPLAVTLSASKSIVAMFTRRPQLLMAAPYGGAIDGGLRFAIQGEPNRNYRIEFSNDLRGWQTLAVITNAYGKVQFFDAPAGDGSRFYRASALP